MAFTHRLLTGVGVVATAFLLGSAVTTTARTPEGSASAELANPAAAALAAQVPPRRVAAVSLHRQPPHRAAAGAAGVPWAAISAVGSNDIPVVALRAYQRAATVMASADSACRLPWTLLAGIGRVESDHGRFAGSRLGTDGVDRPGVFGPPLDGRGPVAAIRDTDHGLLDHDTTWDRAVGPMQIIPSTWRVIAVDGDGDGRRNPQDINDAALAAAVYLCYSANGLDTPRGMAAAVWHYNPSHQYVATVLAYQHLYAGGNFTVPPVTGPGSGTHLTAPAPGTVTSARRVMRRTPVIKPVRRPEPGLPAAHITASRTRHPQTTDDPTSTQASGPLVTETPTGQPTDQPTDQPTQQPTADPSTQPSVDPSTDPAAQPTAQPTEQPTAQPTEQPTEQPTGQPTAQPTSQPTSPAPTSPAPTSPAPTSPALVQLSGTWSLCPDATADTPKYCLSGTPLDLGTPEELARTAVADLDGDGTVENNAAELAGLVGQKVTVTVLEGTDPAVVTRIGEQRYRTDDGTMVLPAAGPNGS